MAGRKESISGTILTRLMKARELSNRVAAEIAGVGATSIHDWKAGVTPTDYAALARLADHLGVQLRYILTGENEKLPPVGHDVFAESASQELNVLAIQGEFEIIIKKIKT